MEEKEQKVVSTAISGLLPRARRVVEFHTLQEHSAAVRHGCFIARVALHRMPSLKNVAQIESGERRLKTNPSDIFKRRGTSMAATIRTAIPLLREPSLTPALFLDEDLVSIPAARIRDEFRKLSRFLPVIVLIPKSAVHDETAQNRPEPNKSAVGLKGAPDIPTPLDAAKTRLRNRSATDLYVFGEVTVNFSAMESHRKGQPVALTRKQFKTLAYLIKNARRVITRDELLNEVWGYQCYPCTRTVDNHILQLRRKLEKEPANPKHFQTVYGTGYRFLP